MEGSADSGSAPRPPGQGVPHAAARARLFPAIDDLVHPVVAEVAGVREPRAPVQHQVPQAHRGGIFVLRVLPGRLEAPLPGLERVALAVQPAEQERVERSRPVPQAARATRAQEGA